MGGRMAAGRMIHIARDTASGLELRSLFWFGMDAERLPDPDSSGFPPNWLFKPLSSLSFVKRMVVQDIRGSALVRHAYEEFNTLASVLPRLFAENAAPHWHHLRSRL